MISNKWFSSRLLRQRTSRRISGGSTISATTTNTSRFNTQLKTGHQTERQHSPTTCLLSHLLRETRAGCQGPTRWACWALRIWITEGPEWITSGQSLLANLRPERWARSTRACKSKRMGFSECRILKSILAWTTTNRCRDLTSGIKISQTKSDWGWENRSWKNSKPTWCIWQASTTKMT